jgi:hypothetical protein
LTLRRFARRLDRMTRATAFTTVSRAAPRAGAACCALAAISQAMATTMRKHLVVTAVARSPDPGRP